MVLTVKKLKSGKLRHQARVRVAGLDRSRTFRRKAEAIRWGADLEKEAYLGRLAPAEQVRERTFDEMIDRYLREVLPRLSFNTQRQRRQQLLFWRGYIGPVKLSAVGSDAISGGKWLLGDRGNGTVNQYLASLRRVYNIARKEWKWLEVNPLDFVENLKAPQARVRYLSPEERQRLLFFCKLSPCRWLHAIVVITLSTGPRKAEIRNIRWTDYDHVRHRIYLDETKTGERRSLPLYGPAREMMAEMYRQRRQGAVHVFQSFFGDYPVDFRHSWEKVLRLAKVENFHFHDLRHSTASYLAMNGATQKQISEVLGNGFAMSARYTHFNPANIDMQVESMNRAFL